jgi:hypothetical protein
MKVQAKDLKVGDIFTETGLTVKITSITRDDLLNGKENYRIVTNLIDYNKKMFSNLKIGLECCYWKKSETIVNVKR